jgi:hypothetical protein
VNTTVFEPPMSRLPPPSSVTLALAGASAASSVS